MIKYNRFDKIFLSEKCLNLGIFLKLTKNLKQTTYKLHTIQKYLKVS